MIDCQPAAFCSDGRRARTYACAVPHPWPAFDQALVIAPLQAIGRFRQPDIIAADLLTAGPVQAVIFSVDLFVENCAILIMRRKDHAALFKMLPIFSCL